MIEMFRYLTTILEKENEKELKRFATCGIVRAVVDIFSFYAAVYFIGRISENPVLTGGLQASVILLMFFSEVVIELYRCKLSNQFLYQGAHHLSMKIFELFVKEDLEYHNQKSVMQALANLRSDTVKSIKIVFSYISLEVDIFTMIGYAVILIFISKWLGVISSIIFFSLMIGIFFWCRTQMKAYGEKCRKYEIKANAQITLGYGIFEEMKISGHIDPVLKKYDDANTAYAQEYSKYSFQNDLITVLMNLWTKAIMLIIFVALFLWGIDLSTFIPVTVYISALSRMASLAYNAVGELNSIEFSKKSYEMLKECLIRYEEIKRREKQFLDIRQKKMTFHRGLYVKNMTFGYAGQENLFQNISMDIPIGHSVAIIGKSGAGKTTFLALIIGLLKPQKGSILYDDYDIVAQKDEEGICKAEIGDIVSYIPQIVYMNGETVRNNVALLAKESEIDDDKVIECLKCAQIWDEITKMPEGIHTLIGENGTAISGGQRQRIALARALYKEFELLVMDEATAALDMETEKAVIDSIRQVRKNKTLLIVTHHMSLADECDIIYKIQDQKMIRVK